VRPENPQGMIWDRISTPSISSTQLKTSTSPSAYKMRRSPGDSSTSMNGSDGDFPKFNGLLNTKLPRVRHLPERSKSAGQGFFSTSEFRSGCAGRNSLGSRDPPVETRGGSAAASTPEKLSAKMDYRLTPRRENSAVKRCTDTNCSERGETSGITVLFRIVSEGLNFGR